jgi:hypothetical protein
VSRRPRFSERDIALLFGGAAPDNDDLAEVAPLVDALRTAAAVKPSPDAAHRFAAQAARITRSASRNSTAAGRRPGSSRRPARVYVRLAGAMAALVLMLSASVGVAYAADASAPGDALHGLDLAMENLGIGNGGLNERLSEAGHLVQKGRVEQGLDAAAEAIASYGGPADIYATQTAEALLAAADTVAASGDPASAAVRAQVAEKLRFMATTDLAGNEFGQAVSDLARGIDSGATGDQAGTTSTTKHTSPTNKNSQPGGSTKGNGKNK